VSRDAQGYPILATDEAKELALQMDVRRNVKQVLMDLRDDAHLSAFYSQETIFNEANLFGDYDSTWGTDLHVWASTHLLKRPIQVWRYAEGLDGGVIEPVVDGLPLGWSDYGGGDVSGEGGAIGDGGVVESALEIGLASGAEGGAEGGVAIDSALIDGEDLDGIDLDGLTDDAAEGLNRGLNGSTVALTMALLKLNNGPKAVPVAHLLFSRKQDSGVMDSNPEAGGHYDLLQPLKPAAPTVV
jgi:hypothetical protein